MAKLKVEDKVRVLSATRFAGEVGTIAAIRADGECYIKSPSANRNFTVHEDFLELYDWEDED